MAIDKIHDAIEPEPADAALSEIAEPYSVNGTGHRRAWILSLGQAKLMTPFRLFAASALLLGTASHVAQMPLLTPIILAYLLGISNFVVNRQQKELRLLRPVLACDDETFSAIMHSLSHHRHSLLNGAWIAGPILMLLVNFRGPGFDQILKGEALTPGLIWGMIVTWIAWVGLCQALVVLFSNSLCFARIGASLTKIDLLNTGSLVPFARTGARNLLIFFGGYALVPIVFWDGPSYYHAILVPLAITLPVAVLLLLLPMNNIRERVAREKDLELDRIQQAMHGNLDALADSPISGDADKVGFTGLVLYRQMIMDINEWPVDYPVFFRLSFYIVIPLLTWIGAALVERFVDVVITILN